VSRGFLFTHTQSLAIVPTSSRSLKQHQSFAVQSLSNHILSQHTTRSTSLPLTRHSPFKSNMFYSTVATAAMLLTLAPSALAVGNANVVNNCGIPVYFASVAQSVHADMSLLPSSGYSESYSLPDVGVSIKLAPNETGSVTQFEFTWADGNIHYDISNINGNPFASGGMQLTPSMSGADGYPTCQPVTCPAGATTCTQAYNLPDDVRTMVCPEDSDLTMVLCPGGSMKREVEFHGHSHRMHARQFR